MQAIYANAGIPGGIGTTASCLPSKMSLLAALPLQHDPGIAFTYGLNIDRLGYLPINIDSPYPSFFFQAGTW
ncbi:hypothetical protein [Paraflavitalea speifideaquila]|uniref:hypothetical protein n=1 Tax=Paraflavitalea speifideaquila TaxID=3076558 RepID=UPI0028F17147|nr:hypothetical protein [Paraflavitalea speifideiaquila]